MVNHMKLMIHTGKKINNKRGSYIVEATLILPIFMIAIMVMSSIISAYSCIEDANYVSANYLRRSAAVASKVNIHKLVPYQIHKELSSNHSQVDGILVNSLAYRKPLLGIDEIIYIDADMRLNTKNPIGFKAEAKYRLKTITRAYVGRVRDDTRMTVDDLTGEGDKAVFIFPKRGEKYHNQGCMYMHSKVKSATLTPRLIKEYDPCPVCKSKRAKAGAYVYYYPVEGECYHMAGCRVMERNYVEITKKIAERRGYTPCSKCGG